MEWTKEKIKRYFERLGMDYQENIEPTYELLKEIQYNHVTKIPYENIDIVNKIPLNFDTEHLYNKMILGNRGGYCFELNKILADLLGALGYEVTSHLTRWLRNNPPEVPMENHRVVIASCKDGVFFCDVGVGQRSPKHPIKLAEGLEQTQFDEKYRFEKDASLGWVLWEEYKGEWRRFISFSDKPNFDVDFIQPSFYCETHPDSEYHKKIMAIIKTDKGRKTLDGNQYKVFDGDVPVFVESDLSDDKVKELLKNEYGIDV